MQRLPSNWREFLYLKADDYSIHYNGVEYLPAERDVFRALELTAPKDVRVVIVGQDPYHTPGKANGLAFSVNKGIEVPKSLQNIFKELHREYAHKAPNHGDLTSWASQGVLLLNRVLTVESGLVRSHRNAMGWEDLTDLIIRRLSMRMESVAFMLWGNDAQEVEKHIEYQHRHMILKAPHPSPLSAHLGFIGCGHFEMANRFLNRAGRGIIQWKID